jgi:hypothetical protein
MSKIAWAQGFDPVARSLSRRGDLRLLRDSYSILPSKRTLIGSKGGPEALSVDHRGTGGLVRSWHSSGLTIYCADRCRDSVGAGRGEAQPHGRQSRPPCARSSSHLRQSSLCAPGACAVQSPGYPIVLAKLTQAQRRANRGKRQQNQLAGAPGFEPGNGGIKIRCLTTWLRPKARRDHTCGNAADQSPDDPDQPVMVARALPPHRGKSNGPTLRDASQAAALPSHIRPLPMRAYRGPYRFRHWRHYSAGCGCAPRCAASAPLTAPAIT